MESWGDCWALLLHPWKKSSWDITGKVCSFQGKQKDNSFLDPSWTGTGNTVSTIFKEECWQRTFFKIRSILLLFWSFYFEFWIQLNEIGYGWGCLWKGLSHKNPRIWHVTPARPLPPVQACRRPRSTAKIILICVKNHQLFWNNTWMCTLLHLHSSERALKTWARDMSCHNPNRSKSGTKQLHIKCVLVISPTRDQRHYRW